MRANLLNSDQWVNLSTHIAKAIGLHFPPERMADLQRGIEASAREFGYKDTDDFIAWLLSGTVSPAQWRTVASQLTVGETYFFREKQTFEALADALLPLIHARRSGERRLRLWSAGCCTGEEAYSLSILLHQLVADIGDWNASILATDINDRFLAKAAAGIYGEWSFRDAPPGFKETYFRPSSAGRYTILPRYKHLVTFAQLNLVEDRYPSLATDTNAMDVIFCRNVLMYFTPPQARKVTDKLERCLLDGGWLIVSPNDGAQLDRAQFAMVHRPGAILHQKRSESRPAPPSRSLDEIAPAPSPTIEVADLPVPPPVKLVAAEVPPERPNLPAESVESYSSTARRLANEGHLREALEWCDRWVAVDKLDACGHYLRAIVLQDLGESESARQALQRAIYLQPQLIVAHFAAGNVAREQRDPIEIRRHFSNALRLLESLDPMSVLPEADGLTAGRLTDIIQSFLSMESPP